MWRPNREIFDVGEDLADTTDAGPVGQWLIGVGLPLVPAVYGVICLWRGRALFLVPSRIPRLIEFQGAGARGAAVVYLSAAAFIHLHWFWSSSPRFWGYAQLGKLLAGALIIAGMVTMFVSVIAA